MANAVKHTNSRVIRVVITRPSERSVRIEVVDRARALPELAKPGDDLLTSGRGLLLVDALAERWGTDALRWTAPNAEKLTVTVPRLVRVKKERQA